MSILFELPGIVERAAEKCGNLLRRAETATCGAGKTPPKSFPEEDAPEACRGYFEVCDNAEFLAREIVSGRLKSAVDLIYIDPPFFSQTEQGARMEIKSTIYDEKVTGRLSAYSDIWHHDMSSYLEMLALRLMLMKKTLKPTGSIFVHLDWHAVHAVKLIMDEIFGEKNFVNEIIWTYKSGGAAKRHYSRKHDTILFYGRTDRYKFYLQKEKSYNRGLKPYRFKGVEEFCDETGWYTMVNQKDVWQIDMVGRSSGERLNYATQKPEALLSRIIDAVTDEGDLTADFFCGSGTLAAVAAEKGRRFVCTDISSLAVANALKRPLRRGFACGMSSASALPFTENAGGKKDFAPDSADPACGSRERREEKKRITAVRRGDTLELLRYEADAEQVPLRLRNEKQRILLREIVRRDPMSLISFWGYGMRKGEIFRFYDAAFREKDGGMQTKLSGVRDFDGKGEGEFLVFAADIFGNIIFIEPDE